MTDVDKRPIAPISIEGIEPGQPATSPPSDMWVNPSELLVDAAYQRDLSERSLRLIRKIVAEWDWRRFKPPIVAMTDAGFECIDGQHTAIAAASHPDIEKILVVVVDATEQAARASAFIGHNRDRLAMTATQIHNAAVVAGDEDALTIAQVTARAGIRVLRVPPSRGDYQPGDTQAIATIATLIDRRGAMRARIVLELLAKAELRPVSANDVRAADHLMHSDEFGGWFAPDALTKAIGDMRATADQEAKVFAATMCVPRWKALAAVWGKNAKRSKDRTQAVDPVEKQSVLGSPERSSAAAESAPSADLDAQYEHVLKQMETEGSARSYGRIVPFTGEPPPGRSALDQRRAEEAEKTGGRR